MPDDEIASLFGTVLREQPEFKPATPADSVDINKRIKLVTAALAATLNKPYCMVIHTDDGPDGLSGKWGIDEPDPAGPARRHDRYCGGAHDGSATRAGFSRP
jgi:hypothetical protein